MSPFSLQDTMYPLILRSGTFHLDMLEDEVYQGWTFGQRWNGWATPMFSFEVAERFMKRYREAVFPYQGKSYYHPARYLAASDTFEFYMEPLPLGSVPTWDIEEIDRYQGHTLPEVGHVYSIGAFCWTWTEVVLNEQTQALLDGLLEGFRRELGPQPTLMIELGPAPEEYAG